MLSLFRKKRTQKILNRNAARRAATGSAANARSKPVYLERWVKTDQLELGMYVAELNVPWEETGFMFQGFNVDSTRLLKQLQDVAEYALVRTQKVAYCSSISANRVCGENHAAV